MTFEDLEKRGWIERIPIDKEEIEGVLELVKRDIKVAQKLINIDLDWAYNLAYNSLLQASFALMYTFGFRPLGSTHKVAITFLREIFGKEYEKEVNALDRARQKRRQATYLRVGTVSELEAKELIELARNFTQEIEERVREKIKARK